MTRIRLLATGGTIASRSGSDGRTASVPAAELLVSVGPLPPGVSVEAVDVASTLSFAMRSPDLQALGAQVAAALDDGCDGVVVTHGTDSMEETAFYLDRCHRDERPVVLTGAQRPYDDPAPDGPLNLAAALSAAAAPTARGCGVLVCFDGVAWPARGVQKVDTLASAAFGAPGRGPVLHVSGGSVRRLAVPERPASPALDPGLPLPRVDVVVMYQGADAALLHAAVAAGAAGLVVAAFGAGNCPPAVTDAVGGLVASGVPVLICSRVGSGPVEALYGGGGGAQLRQAGALFGGDLSPWQARLLLSAALAVGGPPAETLHEWLT
ncbi:MAG: L-asparaginase [Frankiaceae bacterium]|nr:L-asparaginase [Frankiaceae bacterium]MDQ1636290.1 L-asparaginase [Frankiaceae bacterium]